MGWKTLIGFLPTDNKSFQWHIEWDKAKLKMYINRFNESKATLRQVHWSQRMRAEKLYPCAKVGDFIDWREGWWYVYYKLDLCSNMIKRWALRQGFGQLAILAKEAVITAGIVELNCQCSSFVWRLSEWPGYGGGLPGPCRDKPARGSNKTS